ncbi:hypothetical protein ACOTVS_10460 [Aliarcobacter butzleri]|uniref:hypothetical protein n=1 Tax=Aliarcobacter butzleri TaxID=28197 RepID=UPI00344FF554
MSNNNQSSNNHTQLNLFEDLTNKDKDLGEIYTPTGVIRLSNTLIRGQGKINKKVVKRGDKKVAISATTANDKKIEDTCIEIFQAKEIISKVTVNYKQLEKDAINFLEPIFVEYDLIEKDTNTNKKNEEIKHYREIGIESYIKEKVAESIPTEIKFPIKEFIKRTGITRIQSRFNEALKTIHESSNKVSYSWMEQNIEFKEIDGKKFVEQTNELMSGSIIPVFGLGFNDKLKEVLSQTEIKNLTMEKFIELDLPNKIQYVDYFKMELMPKTLVNIVGIGLFSGVYGRGYAKSLRKNRNTFKKSITFHFDFLIRSINNVGVNSHLRKFTLEELKSHLHASSYKSWETFKKSVLLPVIEEFNSNTEMICEYKLLPNQKEWTHIQLIPSWKTDSMGFNASKFGFDYLAYFIAVQHKYFQPNRLDDTLESFVAFVQGEIYSSSEDIELYGKTLHDWKIFGKKIYEAEKELFNLLEENKDILEINNLFYDEKRMCLVRKNLKINEDVDITILDGENKEIKHTKQSRTSYIQTDSYKVKDPITSLRYLNEISCNTESSTIHIFDFIPFEFAQFEAGWIKIYDLEAYNKYLDPIRTAIYKKKKNLFKFENNDMRENFIYYLESRRFKEFDQRFIELMEKLS